MTQKKINLKFIKKLLTDLKKKKNPLPIDPNEENSKITKFTLKLESYLDIPNKNKLASEITKNDLKTLDNSNYLIEYTFSPNDVTKTLQIIVKITSEKKSNLLKTLIKRLAVLKHILLLNLNKIFKMKLAKLLLI